MIYSRATPSFCLNGCLKSAGNEALAALASCLASDTICSARSRCHAILSASHDHTETCFINFRRLPYRRLPLARIRLNAENLCETTSSGLKHGARPPHCTPNELLRSLPIYSRHRALEEPQNGHARSSGLLPALRPRA